MTNIDYLSLGLPQGVATTTANAPAKVPTVTDGYINLPFTSNYLQLIADAFAFIAAQVPGWTPHEGHLEVWATEVWARMVTVSAQVAARVPVSLFEFYGSSLLGILPDPGAAAETSTTWVMADAKGYTVPSGTHVGIPTSGSTLAYFTTAAPVIVAPGATQTDPGAVTLVATTIGKAVNGIPAGPVHLVQSLTFVETITSTLPTSGGADPETTGAYLNRLSDELKLLTPRPILAPDFAALVATQPGVARATAIDNFDATANMLTAVDASFETGVGTWVAGSNCTVATSTTWAGDGLHALALTGSAAGLMTAYSGWAAAAPGQTYTGMAAAHAGVSPNSVSIQLVWADINFASLGTVTSTPMNDNTTGGVNNTRTAIAPASTAYARLQVTATAASAGDIHYFDECAIFLGSPSSWSPGGMQAGQERWVTVVPVDSSGDALTSDEMATLAAYLAAQRELNFAVAVVAPTYTAVTVAVGVVANFNADVGIVQSSVTAAIANYLSPAVWAGGGNTPPVWRADNIVYYLSVARVALDVPGVSHLDSLTLNGTTADVTLSGYASLPVSTVTVTVTSAPRGT